MEELYTKIKDDEVAFPYDVGGAADLIKGMLTKDPAARLTMASIMGHPWVVAAGRELPAVGDGAAVPLEPTQDEIDNAFTIKCQKFSLVAKIKVQMSKRLNAARATLKDAAKE
jgi:serine/threonine protein kinase